MLPRKSKAGSAAATRSAVGVEAPTRTAGTTAGVGAWRGGLIGAQAQGALMTIVARTAGARAGARARVIATAVEAGARAMTGSM